MCYNENTRVGSAERVEKNVLLIKYAYVDALVALHKLHDIFDKQSGTM